MITAHWHLLASGNMLNKASSFKVAAEQTQPACLPTYLRELKQDRECQKLVLASAASASYATSLKTELGSYCKLSVLSEADIALTVCPQSQKVNSTHVTSWTQVRVRVPVLAWPAARHNQSPSPDSGLSCRNMETLLALNLSLQNDLRAFSS